MEGKFDEQVSKSINCNYKAILALEVKISKGLTHGLLKYLNFGFIFMSCVHYFPSS
jgi:hypothetical protein